MQLGKTIRKYRKEKGLTQEEMANRLGVSTPAVNKWENENSYPDILLLGPIARLLGISLDILLSFQKELTTEEINEQLLQKLRMNGVVNGDANIIEKLDRYMADKSHVIPVEKKKDGTFSARSSIMSREELQLVSSYVNSKIREIGREILNGNKKIAPCEKGIMSACTYCAYKKVCGFDPAIPGYKKRKLEEFSQEETLKKMEEELG